MRMDRGMQHVHGHSALTWVRSMDMGRSMSSGMQHGHGNAAWTWGSIDISMQNGLARAASMWAYSMDMCMQHENGHGHDKTWT